eukprot:7155313-Ditylum_brightwellii.AAC.1
MEEYDDDDANNNDELVLNVDEGKKANEEEDAFDEENDFDDEEINITSPKKGKPPVGYMAIVSSTGEYDNSSNNN